MTRSRRSVPALALLLALALPALHPASARAQDVTLKQTSTTTGAPMAGGGGPQTATIYLSRHAIRHSSSDGSDLIMRFDQEKMISIDHAQKTYTALTFDEMQKMIDQAAGAMKQMDPKQAEAMRQVMGGAIGEIKVTKLGPGETIAGYATEKYEVSMPPLVMEMHAAPSLTLPPAYYNAMKLRTPGTPMFDAGRMYDEMKKIEGMVLKQVSTMRIMNMSSTTTTVTTSVDKGALAPSTFDRPPATRPSPSSPDRRRGPASAWRRRRDSRPGSSLRMSRVSGCPPGGDRPAPFALRRTARLCREGRRQRPRRIECRRHETPRPGWRGAEPSSDARLLVRRKSC